jgi:hypothetical protein
MFELKSFGKLQQLTGITPAKFEALASKVRSHYHSFDSKLGGGKWRHIDNPSQDLKSAQSKVLELLRNIELPENMYGAKKGGSVQDHARVHQDQPCILALDLRNCFPKTTHRKVHQVFLDQLHCNPTIARLLTQLCTLDHHLPQGAPTSGYLAHLTLLDLYADLQRIATDHDLKFSMYVDDIALSGEAVRVKESMDRVLAAIKKASHGVRNQKKHLMVGDERRLTGIAIRKKIRIPTDYYEEVEHSLINAARVGSATASDYASLQGKVRWIHSIEPGRASTLENIFRYVERGTVHNKVQAQVRPCRSKTGCFWRNPPKKAVAPRASALRVP